MRMSDVIEDFIKDLFEEDESDYVEIQRNELAQHFNCVPSQINYVISTRFKPSQGYYVESKRGGGGNIKIRKINNTKSDYIMHIINNIGKTITVNDIDILLSDFLTYNIITQQEAKLLKVATSDNVLRLNSEIKDTKDIMAYIEKALSESNASLKLKELEDAEMIKINSLNENYQSYDSVVIAGGNNGKLGKEQYENIDKILIETLKDKDKNIVGVQESNTKFSYVDLYFNDKVTTIDNVDEGIGKLSLVMVLQDSSIAGKFGKLEGSDSIIPYKK